MVAGAGAAASPGNKISCEVAFAGRGSTWEEPPIVKLQQCVIKGKCAHCRRGRLPAARSASSAATTLVAAPGGGSPASERQEDAIHDDVGH